MVGFVGFVSFLACIITLAVSPARWKTFKRMIMTLVGADVVTFVIGALAARILNPRFDLWYLTGELMVCCGILAAAIAGMFQVWAIKNQ